jgi:hypothetical protein
MSLDEFLDRLSVDTDEARAAAELLLWFGFCGVQSPDSSEPRYGYQVQGNLRRLAWMLDGTDVSVLFIPAFVRPFAHL